MSIEKPYQPSKEEMKKAEEMMTPEEREKSNEREETIKYGEKLEQKKSDEKLNERAEWMTEELKEEFKEKGINPGDKFKLRKSDKPLGGSPHRHGEVGIFLGFKEPGLIQMQRRYSDGLTEEMSINIMNVELGSVKKIEGDFSFKDINE